MTSIRKGLFLPILFALGLQAHGQYLPADAQTVTHEQAAAVSDCYSLAHYPTWPPMPTGFFLGGGQFWYSQSLHALIYDDRIEVAERLMNATIEPPPGLDGDGDGGTNSVEGSGTNGLWGWTRDFTNLYVEMVSASMNPSDLARLNLHNTTNLDTYLLLSSESITNALDTWNVERVVIGAEGTNTPTATFIKTRTNALFFAAKQLLGFSNYTAIVTLAGTNKASAFVNGVSNQYSAFTETLVGFSGTIGSLNLGLDNVDWTGPRWSVPQNLECNADLPYRVPWAEPPFTFGALDYPSEDTHPPSFAFGQDLGGQGVAEIAFSAGALATMTNLSLSGNDNIKSLDLHGASGIGDIEAHACPNLAYLSVKGATNLWRLNVEAKDTSSSSLQGPLDLTDNSQLQELRCANNPGLSQVLFPSNGLPNLWHVCLHDGLSAPLNLAHLPYLAELFINNCGQTGSLDSTTLPSTNLYDVRIFNYGGNNRNSFWNLALENRNHLYRLFAQENVLTNAALNGCTNLSEVDLRANHLGTTAIDSVISVLLNNATNGGRVPRVVRLQDQVGGAKMSVEGYYNWINLVAKAGVTWTDHNTNFNADIPEALIPPSILSVTARALDATTEAIAWTTIAVTTNNMIDYGTTTNYGSSVTADGSTTHSNNLSGLSTGTNYFYQVRCTATNNGLSATNTGSFVAGYVPTWACEQVVSTNAGWPDTTLEMTLTTETNNLLVAYVHGSSPPSAPSGWSTVTNASCGTGGYIGLYYKENCAGGATTVSAYGLSLHVLEFSGAAASGALDVYASVPDASATTLPSVSLPTLSSTNELVVAGLACYASPIYPGAGYTGQENAGFVEYRLGVTNTSVTATATFTTSQTYGMIGAAFKPAN